MALWGNKDTKALAGTVTATNGSAAVVGSGTAFSTASVLKVGNAILIDSVPYRVTSITDATHLTISPVYAGSTGSGKAISANESPAYTPAAEIGTVFGVDSSEMVAGGDKVLSVSVTGGGTLYVEAPPVTFSGGGGSGAAATASISGGAVTAIALGSAGSSYETVPTVTVAKARITIPTSGVTVATESIAYTGHGLSAGDAVKYYNGGGSSATGLVDDTTYYVSALGLTANALRLATTSQLSAVRTLTGLVIAGTAGEFTCDAATLAVGDRVRITGTAGGTGSITGYATGNIYKVSAVTGSSPSVTGFTLTTEADAAIVTSAGTPTGLTYSAATVVNITGTGNNAQYLEKSASTAATAVAVKGAGTGTSSTIAHAGWVKRTVGTGGRAGRTSYETLVALGGGISGDAEDTVFPDA